eukprot:1997342-Amphidinium_carterae.1
MLTYGSYKKLDAAAVTCPCKQGHSQAAMSIELLGPMMHVEDQNQRVTSMPPDAYPATLNTKALHGYGLPVHLWKVGSRFGVLRVCELFCSKVESRDLPANLSRLDAHLLTIKVHFH